MDKIFVGLDVGSNGAMVMVNYDGEIIYKTKFSSDPIKTTNSITRGFENYPAQCYIVGIEDVHSIFGSSAKSNFAFGQNKGLLVGTMLTLSTQYQIHLEMVHAKVWQNAVIENEDQVYITKGSKVKKDTKASALNAAKRLLPYEDFFATERSKVPHDGIVDSYLLSRYLLLKDRKDD